MVDAARGVLNQLLADVYIFTDAMSGAAAGASPGYGLTLVAETTTGCLISAEAAATQVGARFGTRFGTAWLLLGGGGCCTFACGLHSAGITAQSACTLLQRDFDCVVVGVQQCEDKVQALMKLAGATQLLCRSLLFQCLLSIV
jgi:hypothetical protein